MPVYRYEVIDATGKRQVDEGEARDREEMLLTLQTRGMILIKWLDKDRKISSMIKRPPKKLGHRSLMVLTKDLAHLLKSDLPMDRALTIIGISTSDEKVRDMTKYLKEAIQGGSSLSEAMANKSHDFNDLYVNMVRVGEMGGVLPAVMERLGQLMERTEEIKRFVISSSIYPTILMGVGILSIFVIMGYVVPKFADIFRDMGQALPWSTMMLLWLSDFLRDWWWFMLGVVTVSVLLLYRWVKTPTGRKFTDRVLLKAPLLGDLMLEIQVSRFSRTLGTLIQSGVPLLKAISIVKEILSNILLKDAVGFIYEEVKEGKRISALMKKEAIFPPMVVQMVSLGEETGKLGEMLTYVADDLDKKTQEKIKTFLALLEPLAILSMGLIIGGIVVIMLSTIMGINDINF